MLAISVSFSAVADAQIYVKIRPPMPVVQVRPPMPTPMHVWVSGDYVNHGGHYEYNEGYWEKPKGNKHRRTEGYWKNSKHGWEWKPGHWK